jgi:hypothetical protein
MLKTLTEIKAANKAAGLYWFSPDTMRFFETTLHDVFPLPDGALFVTGETNPSGETKYSIRRAYDTGAVETVEHFAFDTAADAALAARLIIQAKGA